VDVSDNRAFEIREDKNARGGSGDGKLTGSAALISHCRVAPTSSITITIEASPLSQLPRYIPRMPAEGPWVDRVNGLENVQVDIVMMRTPDGARAA
jgi:hypothetical protein